MNHQFPTTTTTTTNSPNSCSNCYIDDRFLLHNVRLRGTHRRLCTSCVLKLHPCSFCPHCFLIFDNNNPQIPPNIANRGILRCLKCPSESHSNCVPAHVPKSPFLCPPCSNPTFKFFDLRGGKGNGGDGEVGIDERAAKVLVAAARIAAESMRKAAGLARVEAERRVKEAAVARKRAREALERIAQLSAREGERGIRNGVSEGVRHVDGSVMENGSREKNVVVAPMDVKCSDCALELKKEGLIGGGISRDINSSVIGRIDEGSEVENSKVHMNVDAAVSRSMDGNLADNEVSPLGKVDDDINGKLGSDGNTIVAEHMDVDAVDLPSKGVDIAADEVAAIGTVDDEINIVNELEKALGQDVKSEDVPMDADAPVAIQNKDQIMDSEGLVTGAVVEDVGDRGISADVQTLVVKMEKNGGMIANGSTKVGVVSPPEVMESAPEVQILDDVNAKDGAQSEEKEISDEKMGESLPSSSNHEQHLEEKHDEKDGVPVSQ